MNFNFKTKNMLLFKDLEKYNKLSEWKYAKLNVPEGKKDDLISRVSFGNLPESFYLSSLYNHSISNKIPNERISCIQDLKKKGFSEIGRNHIYKYIEFHLERFVKEFRLFLEEEVEYHNIEEMDMSQKLFEIIREGIMLNREEFLAQLESQLCSMKDVMDGEINLKSVEKIVNDLYHKYASDELSSVENCESFTSETKIKYKENVKYTLRKIIFMLTDFIIDSYINFLETETPRDNYEFIMAYEHIKPNNLNILIVEINTDTKGNVCLKLCNNIDFDKFINTDDRCIVLLYFPEEQSYERLIYDSVTEPDKYLEEEIDYGSNGRNKSYPYRYYTFPYQHPMIQDLLQTS